MSIRSMTGFAQIKGQHGKTAYTFSAKSVNHRFLDLHLRLPGRSDLFEQQLRKLFKEKMHRGHIELTLALEYAGASGISINREIVSGYVKAFRELSDELDWHGELDLNAIFRLNGVLSASSEMPEESELQAALLVSQLAKFETQMAERLENCVHFERLMAEAAIPGVRLLDIDPRMTRRSFYRYEFAEEAAP